MKYFETQEPYSALIKAQDLEEAFEKYNEVVSDVDNLQEFYDETKEVSRGYAIAKYVESCEEDNETPDMEHFNKNEAAVLLVDRSLL